MVANALPVVLGSGVYGQTGLTSAGTTQADAYQIIAQVNEFTTVGASSGAVLPVGNYHITVINLGANTLKLYPSVGDLIDNGSANSSINIPVNSSWTGTCSLPATVAPPRRWTTNGTNPVTITNPAITGGTIDNAVIGGSTPAAGTFTTLSSTAGVYARTILVRSQGAQTALTTSATLTAAQLLTGILTANQGGAGAAAYQLPLASAMDSAVAAAFAVGDSFDFSVINVSTVAAEAASLTTNTGWTLVGDMDIIANSASTTKSAGMFRARKTATGAWTLYRIS